MWTAIGKNNLEITFLFRCSFVIFSLVRIIGMRTRFNVWFFNYFQNSGEVGLKLQKKRRMSWNKIHISATDFIPSEIPSMKFSPIVSVDVERLFQYIEAYSTIGANNWRKKIWKTLWLLMLIITELTINYLSP